MASTAVVPTAPPPTLTIKPHPTKSRILTAAQSFAPGSLIALFESPIICIPAGPNAKVTCSQCLRVRLPVRLCTGCSHVAYCGAVCQKAHWKAIHRLECKMFKRVNKSAKQNASHDWLPASTRALAQILLRLEEEGKEMAGDGNEKERKGLRTVLDWLEGNVEGFKKHKTWGDVQLQALGACRYSGWKESEENLNLAMELFCKLQTNSFDRGDPDLGTSGLFLDPILAMANHSCIPSAVVAFVGMKAYLRARQPVEAGDEITISYIDFTKPKVIRQRALSEGYHFMCDCRRCSKDLDVYQVCSSSPALPVNSLSFVPSLEDLRNPDIDTSTSRKPVFRRQVDEIYNACNPESSVTSQDRLAYLRHAWEQCAPLIEARIWATEPLAHVFQQALTYYREQGENFKALAVACFVVIRQDPYKYVPPFATSRLKSLVLIAEVMTALTMRDGQETKDLPPGMMEILQNADEASIFQAIILMVLHYGPMGHSSEWEVLGVARQMLNDVDALEQTRRKDSALVKKWIENPDDPTLRRIFQDGVVQKVKLLGDLAVSILKADLESRSGAAPR